MAHYFPFDFEDDRRKKLASEGYELLVNTYPNALTIHRDVMIELDGCLKEQLNSFDKMVYMRIKGHI